MKKEALLNGAYDVLLTTYDTLRADFHETLSDIPLELAIFDEVHKIKGRNTKVLSPFPLSPGILSSFPSFISSHLLFSSFVLSLLLLWSILSFLLIHSLRVLFISQVTSVANAIKTTRRYGLTGTVMQNSFEELWTLLDFVRVLPPSPPPPVLLSMLFLLLCSLPGEIFFVDLTSIQPSRVGTLQDFTRRFILPIKTGQKKV